MATSEFDITLPSIRLVQKWIKEKATVEFKLMTGDLIIGKVFWQDHTCISVIDANNEQFTIWKQAIAYSKPQTEVVTERSLVPMEEGKAKMANIDS
ncbi:hypothetical protein B6N60_04717 [Richelia sinica FACHB-800]|uniref:Hfq-related domain-containing protein n=2 Tax=Richelia TaxID=98443 RepID=A0A975Y761_9NOST|nr:hypothetical protein [Richelia sinica]MBD2665065.1 hypothetical protein [Richelia sinica FACHB-800]QXE25995.1 hypothetical protein B6N60_04717 [Richelia sinica FACHB-800]